MGFISVCTALYDYAPQNEEELQIKEGELVYILEKSSEDDWWKAKKRGENEDDEEPIGLIPNNYVKDVSKSSPAPMSSFWILTVCIVGATFPPSKGSLRLFATDRRRDIVL